MPACVPLLWTLEVVRFCRFTGARAATDLPALVLRQETPDWEIWVANQIADLIEVGFHNPPLLTTAQLFTADTGRN
jgi:hypothetical protein